MVETTCFCGRLVSKHDPMQTRACLLDLLREKEQLSKKINNLSDELTLLNKLLKGKT